MSRADLPLSDAATDRRAWRSVVRILKFAKPHWLLLTLVMASMFAYAASEGAYLVLMKPFLSAFSQLVDKKQANAIPEMELDKLRQVGVYALLLAPVVAVLAYLQQYLSDRMRLTVVVDLRNALCRAIMPQSLSFFEDRRSGDLMSRITNDITRSQGAFQQLFNGIPENCAHLLMGIGVAAWFNWQLLLMGFVVAPAVIFPVGSLAKRIRRYGRQGLEKLADITDLMSQMFSGIRIIKAFRMEDAEAQEFEYHNRKFMQKMMKMVMARGLSAGIIEFVIRTFIGCAILIGIWFFARYPERIDMGNILICIGGIYYAFNALRKLVKAYNELHEIMPATDRVMEIIEHVPELVEAPDAIAISRLERGMSFKNVTFSYDTEVVLRDVSFDVRKGQTVAIVGRSGAGKSTLIALLCRFYDPTEGVIEFDGRDLRKITQESLLERVAIVSQQTFLFNRSIAENIRYGKREATQAEVEEAARAANIHDFIVTLPDGYDSLCGEFGTKLSGGQRQRIAIARALLKDAEILILDEAMVGLDKESENSVADAIQRLMKGRTVFTISHDLPTIQNAALILVLEDGRLIGKGKHEELLEACEEYRELYKLQFPSR